MDDTDLAFFGGPKTTDKLFPWPEFDETEAEAVTGIVRSGIWGNPDCKGIVEELENTFASYCGVSHAIACSSGSVALRLALIASGVKPGDEVIVPSYTFVATASVVVEANCIPVFADIHPDTYNLSAETIRKVMTSKTKVVIPVHFGGQACQMDEINELARQHGLTVIEDACHGHGGEYRRNKLGALGDAGCFSFQSSKNLTCGEGGIVVTRNPRLSAMIDSLRNVGRVAGGMWYEHHYLGCNYRITQLQAALLMAQLRRLEGQTLLRNNNGIYLNRILSKIPGIQPLTRGHGETIHPYHIFIFRYDQAAFHGLPRHTFVNWLSAEGIPCSAGYPWPLYKQPVFREKNFMCYVIPDRVDYTSVYCPVAEKACYEEAVWIPQQVMLGSEADMDQIAASIEKIRLVASGMAFPGN